MSPQSGWVSSAVRINTILVFCVPNTLDPASLAGIRAIEENILDKRRLVSYQK